MKINTPNSVKHLYIDVSVTARKDVKTGIQRVVRAITLEMLKNPPEGYSIVPVYLDQENNRWFYKNLQSTDILFKDGHSSIRGSEYSTRFSYGDLFLGLDLVPDVINADRQDLYDRIRNLGTKIVFVVYDILPVEFPQFYSQDDSRGHEDWMRVVAKADMVVGISSATADSYKLWLSGISSEKKMPKITYFHLGADLISSAPSKGLPSDGLDLITQIGKIQRSSWSVHWSLGKVIIRFLKRSKHCGKREVIAIYLLSVKMAGWSMILSRD